MLLKLARNAEQRLNDVDQAVGFLRQLLDADPGNGFGYLELERILRDAERWYDLVDVLAKHAETEGAAGRKPTELALRVAIANVWEKELDSPESAAEALERVLEVAPDNAAALLSLARLHERAERWDDAAETLERAAAHAASPPEISRRFTSARPPSCARRAPSPTTSSGRCCAPSTPTPTHRPTLEALEAIARAAKDDERLVSILDLQLQTATTDAERAKLLREIAALLGGPLGQPAAALPHLERLVALDPTEIAGREQLAEALIAAGRGDEATRLIGEIITELAKARRGKEAARWHTRLGTIAEARGDSEAASAAFNAAYKLDPSHPATIAALGRLAYRRSDFEAARKFYRSLLLQNFEEATAGVSKAEVYLMLGRMHVLANELPKARNMFERGLEVDPRNVSSAALASLAARWRPTRLRSGVPRVPGVSSSATARAALLGALGGFASAASRPVAMRAARRCRPGRRGCPAPRPRSAWYGWRVSPASATAVVTASGPPRRARARRTAAATPWRARSPSASLTSPRSAAATWGAAPRSPDSAMRPAASARSDALSSRRFSAASNTCRVADRGSAEGR